MLKKDKLQEWEDAQISTLTLKLILAATGGTLAATAIAYVLKTAGLGEVKPELLFVPWGIALVAGVSLAFRRGVMAERERAAQAAEQK
jgi:hypothetical protein